MHGVSSRVGTPRCRGGVGEGMAGWADLWYAHQYFVRHFGPDLADNRPAGSGHPGNTTIPLATILWCRSSAIDPSPGDWARLVCWSRSAGLDWKGRATCTSLAASRVRD